MSAGAVGVSQVLSYLAQPSFKKGSAWQNHFECRASQSNAIDLGKAGDVSAPPHTVHFSDKKRNGSDVLVAPQSLHFEVAQVREQVPPCQVAGAEILIVATFESGSTAQIVGNTAARTSRKLVSSTGSTLLTDPERDCIDTKTCSRMRASLQQLEYVPRVNRRMHRLESSMEVDSPEYAALMNLLTRVYEPRNTANTRGCRAYDITSWDAKE
eukprot:761933-Amphidinium_carterae.1